MTLIEIMIGVTLIGVLAAFSVPEIVKLAPKFRARSEAMAFASKLNRLRAESLSTKPAIAVFVPGTDGSTKIPTTMTIFVDENNNHKFDASLEKEKASARWDSANTPIKLDDKSGVQMTVKSKNWIGFTPFGYPLAGSTLSFAFTGTLLDGKTLDDSSKVIYTVSVTAGGTISVDLTSS